VVTNVRVETDCDQANDNSGTARLGRRAENQKPTSGCHAQKCFLAAPHDNPRLRGALPLSDTGLRKLTLTTLKSGRFYVAHVARFFQVIAQMNTAAPRDIKAGGLLIC